MKISVIANPAAGGKRGFQRLLSLIRACERRGHGVRLHLTSRPGDGERAASTLNLYGERLVVAGGDGTVNEVVNGLRDPSAAPLAVFPMGTSNVLARELGLPRDPEAFACLVERGAIRRIALGEANARRFVLFASVGFEALVTREVARTRSLGRGLRRYPLPVWKALRRYRPFPLTVSVASGPRFRGAMALVSHVRRLWGPFRFSPGAECDSERFEITVARDGTLAEVVARYSLALIGQTGSWLTGSLWQGQTVLVESPWPAPVQVDGDYRGTTPVAVRMIPSRLSVLV